MIEEYLKSLNGQIWKRYYFNNKITSYLVSEYGLVYSEKSNKIMKSSDDGNGYLKIKLMIHGKSVHKKIHQIVAETFHIIILGDANQVNHIDGNKMNNHYRNLEWCTPTYNNQHSSYNNLTVRKYDNDIIKRAIILLSKEVPLITISKNLGINIKSIPYIRHKDSYKLLKSQLNIDLDNIYYTKTEKLRKDITNILKHNVHMHPVEICNILGLDVTEKNIMYVRDRKKKHIRRMKERSTTRES